LKQSVDIVTIGLCRVKPFLCAKRIAEIGEHVGCHCTVARLLALTEHAVNTNDICLMVSSCHTFEDESDISELHS
jgi:hypothetical protein